MSALELAPAEAPVRFVVAKSDLECSRDGIKFCIPAGSLRRADDDVVRAAPARFYDSTEYTFRLELREYSDGRLVGEQLKTATVDHYPPPGPKAEDYWQRHFSRQLGQYGNLSALTCQRTGPAEFTIRAGFERAAPPTPTIVVNVPEQPAPTVVVNVDNEPVEATVTFERDPAGRLSAATISGETPDTADAGILP